jgi:hypothetical protein
MKTATRTIIRFGTASSLFAAACCFAGAASVSGSFNSNDSKYGNHPYAVKVASGCAFRDKARFDDKQVTVVVLSDKPVDAAAIANSADRRAALREQMDAAKANYVEWEVSEGNTSPTLYEHVVAEHGVNNLGGMFTATYKANDASHIEGHVSNDPAGKDYPTDLTFSLPVAPAKS